MSNNALTKLGHKIRQVRLSRSLSQEQLAQSTGLHRTYIGGVERGERNLGFMNLLRISQALGVTVSELVEGIERDLTL